METFQHQVLPFGSLMALFIFGWAIWVVRKPQSRSLVIWVLVAGLAGAAAVVGALVALYRLPWAFACLDCLESNPWFSVLITALQGFGFSSALALGVHRLYSRSHAGAA
jgi:hypothetical protein